MTVKIAGKRYTLTVSAPKSIRAGAKATLKVTLSKAAAARLAGRRTTVSLKVTVGTTTRTVKVTVRGKARR